MIWLDVVRGFVGLDIELGSNTGRVERLNLRMKIRN